LQDLRGDPDLKEILPALRQARDERQHGTSILLGVIFRAENDTPKKKSTAAPVRNSYILIGFALVERKTNQQTRKSTTLPKAEFALQSPRSGYLAIIHYVLRATDHIHQSHHKA
jgi:hypothetical protein